ncbi:hypothetical protein ABFX02_03G057300 [Erythranthe guttata]
MEKFVYRGNNFPANSPAAQSRSSEDLDFDDVFGGPPRRFSMQEVKVRYSFGGGATAAESEEDEEEEEGGASASSSSPWSSRKEKPVFGEESASQRKRNPGGDFFDDIFKGGGGDSYPSPRRSDTFGSNPGSRIMSPARPLPPKPDPFGSSPSAPFSLPGKSTKGVELPAFSSRNYYSSVNGLNSPRSSSSLSRFSNQAVHPQRALSREASFSSEDSVKSDQKESFDNSKKESAKNGDQFHFSIYKWAGRGVPMLMTFVGGGGNNLTKSNSKSNDNVKFERSASYNGRLMENEFLKMENEPKDSIGSVRVVDIKEEQVGSKKIEKRVYTNVEDSLESEVKPLRAGNVTNVRESKHVTKNEGTRTDSRNDSGVTSRRSKVKGKVRDFVQIFNQETESTPKADVQTKSQSSRWKNDVGVDQQKESEVIPNEARIKTVDDLRNVVDRKKDVPDKVDEKPSKIETEQYSTTKTPMHNKPESSSINQEKAFSSETLHTDPKISVENSDDAFEVNFMVQELSEDHDKVAESEISDDTKAIDAKIRQWSSGKKGNIRSLLSTLQYVLWPESGWKSVPLVDLIEANSVKRAYQKALLRLHPDKLQQKGAAFHQKYTAEKVFDILQEAWDHFNTSSSLNL